MKNTNKNTNTNTNKTMRRVSGIALSALMLMSVAGATLCTANAATADEATVDEAVISAQTQSYSGTGKVERIDELKSHDGRVYAPATSNWFAIRNTADGKQTYITASGVDGEVTIEVLNGDAEVIISETADLAQTDMMKVQIPMNAEDGVFYFVNVYQNAETASTENYSVNHLSQGYIDMLEATSAPFCETVTIKSQPGVVEGMDGTTTTFDAVKDTFYISTGEGTTYTFDISADCDLEYSYIVTDFDGNFVTEGHGIAKNGYVQEHTLELEEHGSYFVHFSGVMAEAGDATFTFGAKR